MHELVCVWLCEHVGLNVNETVCFSMLYYCINITNVEAIFIFPQGSEEWWV